MSNKINRGIIGAATLAVGIGAALPASADSNHEMREESYGLPTAAFATANVSNDTAIAACIFQNLENNNNGSHIVRSEEIRGFSGPQGSRVVNAVKLIMGDQELAGGAAVEIQPIKTGPRQGDTFLATGVVTESGFDAEFYAFIGKDGAFSDVDGKPMSMFAEMNPDVGMPADLGIVNATVKCIGMKGPGDR